MVEVYLAGFNVDTDTMKNIADQTTSLHYATPETISAAYARISRNPKPVNELRKIAREEIEKARDSNRRIIFEMGHHSVAEHAVFNFDIIGISRLAIEAVEHFRLCSFTEKSQRYIKLHGNYVVPGEIAESGLKDHFSRVVEKQNRIYTRLFDTLYARFKDEQESGSSKKELQNLKIKIKEDVRYITSLATRGQLGMTVNARNLELMIRRFAAHPLRELNELGEKLLNLVKPVAPSIILFSSATDYDSETPKDLREYSFALFRNRSAQVKSTDSPVKLLHYTAGADDIVLASILHTFSDRNFDECRGKIAGMSGPEKLDLVKIATRKMEFYDTVSREFEYVNLVFELIVSASCFAQLKRHRMATITVQPYSPIHGVTIPDLITEYGEEKTFRDMINETDELYWKMVETIPAASEYVLTNAHRRRLLVRLNARDLYHFSRLREDKHAQWDIRNIATEMLDQTKKIMPITFLLACGKHQYHELYEKIFGYPPKIDVAQE